MKRGPGRPGTAGEDLACRHLRTLGFEILDRNFTCRGGEIDIVARDGETVVFVEVKDRSCDSHGTAIEAVTHAKRVRVARAARFYALCKGMRDTCPVRFDVVAIDRGRAEVHVRHERGAFDD